MTLFDGGYTWFRIKQANQSKRAAENDLQDAINSTAYQVKIAYYTLLARNHAQESPAGCTGALEEAT